MRGVGVEGGGGVSMGYQGERRRWGKKVGGVGGVGIGGRTHDRDTTGDAAQPG